MVITDSYSTSTLQIREAPFGGAAERIQAVLTSVIYRPLVSCLRGRGRVSHQEECNHRLLPGCVACTQLKIACARREVELPVLALGSLVRLLHWSALVRYVTCSVLSSPSIIH
jgi:hypothetical protein